MSDLLKIGFQHTESFRQKKNISLVGLSYMHERDLYFCSLSKLPLKKQIKLKKKFYKKQEYYAKFKIRRFVDKLATVKIKNLWLNFFRWILIDWIKGRRHVQFGIYQFIALPGEGKTMSMVAHMERFRAKMEKLNKPYIIATNFSYKYQNYRIDDWVDIVKIANWCYRNNIQLLVSMDEIHVTFDSSEWKDFPPQLLAVLSFVRKYGMEFLVSAQIYERIPKKIRDIANFTIVCKNVWRKDRMYRNYYYEKSDYEMNFEDTKGKKKKSKFKRVFVADDVFFSLYDTKEQVDRMVDSAKEEKKKREDATIVLFGGGD